MYFWIFLGFFCRLIFDQNKRCQGFISIIRENGCVIPVSLCANNNKIRDLFKVKLYTIRSETKKKRKREREREKKREREREKKKQERERERERDRKKTERHRLSRPTNAKTQSPPPSPDHPGPEENDSLRKPGSVVPERTGYH